MKKGDRIINVSDKGKQTKDITLGKIYICTGVSGSTVLFKDDGNYERKRLKWDYKKVGKVKVIRGLAGIIQQEVSRLRNTI